MEYINIETGQIREFSKTQPIPKEYTLHNITKEGEQNPMYGKHHDEETKKKIGQKNAAKMKGKHWYTNGSENVLQYECPEGFQPGRS